MRDRGAGGGTPLPHSDLGAGQKLQHPVHHRVGHEIERGIEAAGLEDVKGAHHGIVRLRVTRREQLAAVGRYLQGLMVRACVDQPEQGQHPGPGPEAARQPAVAPHGGPLQGLEQPLQAITGVVHRVRAGEQLAALGKENHHHAHDHPHGRPVDVRARSPVCPV